MEAGVVAPMAADCVLALDVQRSTDQCDAFGSAIGICPVAGFR